jgi:transposase-like protein
MAIRMPDVDGIEMTVRITKTVIETASNEETTEHLGYEKHGPAGAGTGNIRNGTRSKTVLTEASGHVEVDVPRIVRACSPRRS